MEKTSWKIVWKFHKLPLIAARFVWNYSYFDLYRFQFLSYLKWYFTMLHTTQVLSPVSVFVGVSRGKQDPFWWINIRKNKDQNSSLLKTKIYFFIQKQGTSECLQKKDSTAADICLKKDFLRFQGCIKAG